MAIFVNPCTVLPMKNFLPLVLMIVLGTARAQDKAKIVFIRDIGHFGSAVDFREFIDEKLVCKLDRKSYNIIDVEPGQHTVTWQPNCTELKKAGRNIQVVMDFEAGKTYYFEMGVTQKFTKYELSFDEITESTALKKMAALKEDTNCFK